MTDSQGILSRLPIPLSAFTCLGIFIFVAKWNRKVVPAYIFIFTTLGICLLSLWLASEESVSLRRKTVLIAQVLLPMAGLCLGLLISDATRVVARAFLTVLSVVIPSQLLATWLQGRMVLTHDLYAFSIYSHLQYVTLIFVCAFFYCFTVLWPTHKRWLCVMSCFMLVYAVASMSFLTIFAYVVFQTAFIFAVLWRHRGNVRFITLALGLFAIAAILCGLYIKSMESSETLVSSKQGLSHWLFQEKYKRILEGKIPGNLEERLGDWKLFGAGIVESKKAFFFGHAEPMPREIRSSPHNWYIDMVYNFGIFSILPILGLIGYTSILIFKNRKQVTWRVWWLAVIVSYLVAVDSNFKVTLRQPYPGIFAYFLFGILLSTLRATNRDCASSKVVV